MHAHTTTGKEVADLALTFSLDIPGNKGAPSRTVDLLPGGRDIEVTNANVLTYVHLLAHFKLNLETAAQCRAFLRGFRDLVPVPWIRLFSPRELQRLIGGDSGDRGIDIADLKANMKYAGGYHPSQPVMQWFWAALESFTPKEQALFLKFVTSCSRQPLLGFTHLAPPICVQKVPAGVGGNKLPSSATCMNLLKLPQYEDAQTLRDKLLYAISAEAGFELT
jgi:ubiquitin-protein ligase E3 C